MSNSATPRKSATKANIRQRWRNAMEKVLKNKKKLQQMEKRRSRKFNSPLNKKKTRQRRKQRNKTMYKPGLNNIKENNIYSPKPIKMKRVKKSKKSNNNNVISDLLRSKFSNQHNDTYLKGHATKPVKSYGRLSNAMRNASNRNNVGGITRGKGKKYTLRKGTELITSKDVQSWLKANSNANAKANANAKSLKIRNRWIKAARNALKKNQ
jgi:hypothetical protein